jgi:3-oxoacyl-[acyl-carrier protein] reductase
MDLGIKGKVALVTGAGSQIGFGKVIAITLAREGCDVIVTALHMEGAEKTAAAVRKETGRKAVAIQADISDKESARALVRAGLAEFGRIDILVNNAGAMHAYKSFSELTEEEGEQSLNLNLRGAIIITKAVLPGMLERKWGKIVNITSIGARKGMQNTTFYGTSKAGLIGFTQVIANELIRKGINVNGVSPGLGRTNFGGANLPVEMQKADPSELIPSGRPVTGQDIANMVAFLASDVSADIVGQNINVDGGESIV